MQCFYYPVLHLEMKWSEVVFGSKNATKVFLYPNKYLNDSLTPPPIKFGNGDTTVSTWRMDPVKKDRSILQVGEIFLPHDTLRYMHTDEADQYGRQCWPANLLQFIDSR